MTAPLTIPEPVRLRAIAAGPAGATWLAALPTAVADLAQRWRFTSGRVLEGGSEGLVVAVTLDDGRAAVLKLLAPEAERHAGEVQTLLAARGRGYAEVYAYDPARMALLLERLGPPLAERGLPVETQLAMICATLAEAWAAPPGGVAWMTGAAKADSLLAFIETTWQELGQPCSARVIDLARRYAAARRVAFDRAAAVLAHGDAHPWNTLLVPGDPRQRCKFVDPDGLVIERAYDLAISMREWSDELLAGDPLSRGRARCRLLADLTGVAPEPIWQWDFLERTSTGLLCLKLGLEGGRAMLAVAEAWTQAA